MRPFPIEGHPTKDKSTFRAYPRDIPPIISDRDEREASFHSPPSPPHFHGPKTPIRCNKNNTSIPPPQSDHNQNEAKEVQEVNEVKDENMVKEVKEAKDVDRLAILQEIRLVLDMKQKAKMMQEDEEVQLLSRHLSVLNEELNRLRIGCHQPSSLSEKENCFPSKDHIVGTVPDNAHVPVKMTNAPDETMEKPTEILKASESFADSSMKKDTVKIRAPSALKGGYEFTANVNGRVIKALVVSSSHYFQSYVHLFVPNTYYLTMNFIVVSNFYSYGSHMMLKKERYFASTSMKNNLSLLL